MTAPAAVAGARMTERQLQECITEAARTLGYLVYSVPDSRRSEPGYPDLTIAGYGSIWFIECKTERGRLRGPSVTKRGRVLPSQQDWLDELAASTVVRADVVRPADLDDVLARLQRLAGRD